MAGAWPAWPSSSWTSLAERFGQAGFLFWAPQRPAGGNLVGALKVGRRALEVALEDPQVDQERIALLGFSQGSWVAALVGLTHPQVRAIGLLGLGSPLLQPGPGPARRLEGLDYGQVRAAVLIQAAGGDEVVDDAAWRQLQKRLTQAGHQARVIVYPGARHDGLCGLGTYLDDTLAFVKESLR